MDLIIYSAFLGNQKCMIQSTLTNLHPNEYSQIFTTIYFRFR